MERVGKNVTECFELHLRGFDIHQFFGEAGSKPHK